MRILFWFRSDLRLYDNPALANAVKASDDLIPVFILDENLPKPLGGAQRWWLHHSLTQLALALKKKGVSLVLQKGDAKTVLAKLAKKYSIDAIYWNRTYEPPAMQLDETLQQYFDQCGVETQTFNGRLLTEPHQVKNKTGQNFKVFTPFYKTVNDLIEPTKLFSIPQKIHQKTKIKTERLDSWDLLPKKPDWSKGFKIWSVGEQGARKVLKNFIDDALEDYAKHRDRPDLSGTSRLSPHLHFGEISVRQVWALVKQAQQSEPRLQKGAEMYLRQLIWREFSYYLLHYYPSFYKKNYRSEFDDFEWSKSKKNLRAWQKGLTGYPIVDAGMHELWTTGYLHNRVRMIVASFLTKDLLIDWRAGEKWFWDTLVDADLANNSAGWQWVAGSGADAAPYFRIFNPTLQGLKFDPQGDYVRKWLPVLKKLPKKYIHEPKTAPEDVLSAAGVELGSNYPLPIIDHGEAREAALARYRKLK